MRCLFCYREKDVAKLSKEHLLSKPVADAFGVDRTATFGRFGNAGPAAALGRLDGLAVRFACVRCNNTWMNELERAMASVAPWAVSPGRALTTAEVEGVRAWGLKTYLVLSMIEGNARRFTKEPRAPGVVPNATRARRLYERDARAFEGTAFGLARPPARGEFAYAFGNPTVVPQGPRYANRKSAGAAIVTVGPLQIWVAEATIFPSATIELPRGVTPLGAGVTYADLGEMPLLPEIDDVVVDNGEHDIVALLDRATAQARAQGLIGP